MSLDQAVVLKKAMHPAGEVAGTIGQHRILRQMLLQQADDGRHVNFTGQGLRHQIAQVVGVG